MNHILGGFLNGLGLGRSATPSSQSSFSNPPSAAASIAGSAGGLYHHVPPRSVYSAAIVGAGGWAPSGIHSTTTGSGSAGGSVGMPAEREECSTPEEVALFYVKDCPNVTFDRAAQYYQRVGSFDLKHYWRSHKDKWLCPLEPEDSYRVELVANLIRIEEVAGIYPHAPLTSDLARSLGICFRQIVAEPVSFEGWTYDDLQYYADDQSLWSYTLIDLRRE